MQRIGSDRDPAAEADATGADATGADAGAGEDAGDVRAPASAGGSRRFGGRLSLLLWAGGLLLVGVGLFSLYVRQSLVAPFNSDGASNILQAQAMLHGNPLLKGWWTSDVSFYTTELPEYMLVVLVRGVRPDVVHIAGALSYTLTVLLGALLARGRARGRAGVARALLAGGIMLAPGILGGTEVFLENPDHAGTAVPILVVLLLLDRAPERWWVPVAVGLLLAGITVADQLTLVAATVPLAAVAAVRLLMLAVRRRPRREYRYDAMLLAAAVASIGVAKLAEAMIRHLGGYYLRPLTYQLFAPVSQIPGNARMMGQTLLLLFGANDPDRAHQQIAIIATYHLIGLALAVLGFAVAVALFFTSRADRVTQVIVAATAATLAAGVVGTILPSLAHAHEVAILLPFGAVLAGRMLSFPVGQNQPAPLVPARWRPGLWAVPALAAWLAAGLAALCFAATWFPLGPPNQDLATWLVDHHYSEGLAGYWQANATTVTSGGKVLVAPIKLRSAAVWRWEASSGWYDASQRQANFIIATPDQNAGLGGVTPSSARRSFGRPARQYEVGKYVIMVYDYNLLTRLSGREFPGVDPPNH